jgi:hypothetical protein
LTDEPVVADAPPATLPSPASTTYDKGFVPRGYRREPAGDEWKTVKDDGRAALDIYADRGTFMEPNATVQIVTFYMGEDNCQQTRWERVLKRPAEVKEALGRKQEANTWRWIHCEGLHGPTMKAIAEGTGTFCSQAASILQNNRLHRVVTGQIRWNIHLSVSLQTATIDLRTPQGPAPVPNGPVAVCLCTFWTK